MTIFRIATASGMATDRARAVTGKSTADPSTRPAPTRTSTESFTSIRPAGTAARIRCSPIAATVFGSTAVAVPVALMPSVNVGPVWPTSDAGSTVGSPLLIDFVPGYSVRPIGTFEGSASWAENSSLRPFESTVIAESTSF